MPCRRGPLLALCCVLSLACLRGTPAHAQDVGVIGGLTMAEINASGDESLNVALTDKAAPLGGVLVAVHLSDAFVLEPEILLTTKGSRLEVGALDARIRLRYLEVPVLLRYSPDTGAARLHFMAGPYYAHLLSARASSSRGPALDVEDVFASRDIGWLAGLGVGTRTVRVDLRYVMGLSTIARGRDFSGPFAPAGQVSFRNRSFVLAAAVVF